MTMKISMRIKQADRNYRMMLVQKFNRGIISSSKTDQFNTNVPDESSDTEEKEEKFIGLLEK